MAADKQAYARSLGPSAMSYLMGFVPGDQGWIGGGGDDDDDGDKDDDDDKADGIDGGINADKKGAGINGVFHEGSRVRVGPKAYAFDPMNPAASAKAAAAMTVAGSEGDGQQSLFAAGSGEEMGEDDGQEGAGAAAARAASAVGPPTLGATRRGEGPAAGVSAEGRAAAASSARWGARCRRRRRPTTVGASASAASKARRMRRRAAGAGPRNLGLVESV